MTTSRPAHQAAADLLAAAARHPAACIETRLACLAAEASLGVPGRPLTARHDSVAPDELISKALRSLGELPLADFDDPRVLAACRHARNAMRART